MIIIVTVTIKAKPLDETSDSRSEGDLIDSRWIFIRNIHSIHIRFRKIKNSTERENVGITRSKNPAFYKMLGTSSLWDHLHRLKEQGSGSCLYQTISMADGVS